MDRNERQLKIIELVKTGVMETQGDLVKALNDLGYSVTQATISRDIKDLGLIKVNKGGRYQYAVAEAKRTMDVSDTMLVLFREVVERVAVSQNLVVVRTHPGNAPAVGAMIDNLGIQNVLGTLSGDDTLLIIADSSESAPLIAERLKLML